MKTALREGNFEAQDSFTHTLQLVVHDGVLSQCAVIDNLAICRSIVRNFKGAGAFMKQNKCYGLFIRYREKESYRHIFLIPRDWLVGQAPNSP